MQPLTVVPLDPIGPIRVLPAAPGESKRQQGDGWDGIERRHVLDGGTGKMVNANWHDYKIPTAMDVPAELTCLPIDPHDMEVNSTGTKGLAEPALVPAPPAIANAFYNATGVRPKEAPFTPANVITLLNQDKKQG